MILDRHDTIFTHILPQGIRQSIEWSKAPETMNHLQEHFRQFLTDTVKTAEQAISPAQNPSPEKAQLTKQSIAELAYSLLAIIDMHPLLMLDSAAIQEIQEWITQQDEIFQAQQLKAAAAGDERLSGMEEKLKEALYYGPTGGAVRYEFTPTYIGTAITVENRATGNSLNMSHAEEW